MMRIFLSLMVLCLGIFGVEAKEPATVTAHGAALFGDMKYGKDFTHFEYANPDAPKGGRITLAAIGSYDSLQPFIVKGQSAAGLMMMFDTLLAGAEDEPSSAYGLLAESITQTADNTWVEYTLRKEAKFSDGTPVTPEDVIFSFNTLREKGHPHYKGYYRDVKSVEKRGERGVRFVFSTSENRELAQILGQFPILSKASFAKRPFEEAGMVPLLGSGPYLVDKAEPGKFIRYKRNPNYWGKDLPVNKGRYNFDEVQMDYYRDETVAVQALVAGQYDLRQENIARIWATSYESPAIKEGRLIKEEIAHSIPTGLQGFFFNTRRAKFSDRRVRQAIALAFDFEWANKNLFYSSYSRAQSYFSNSELASQGLPSEEEKALLEPFKAQLPPEVFSTPFSLPVNKEPADIRAQLVKAKGLLEAAGWKITKGALTNAAGEALTIEFMINSPSFERVIAPFVKNLSTLGIKASIRLVDSAQYQKRMDQYDYDMVVHVYGQSLSPGNEQINYWHSSKADVEGSQNYAGIKNPAVDAMIEKIVNAKDRPALTVACRALDRILLNEFYAVPNWYFRKHRLVYWKKFGKPKVAPKYGTGIPDSWWAEEAKPAK